MPYDLKRYLLPWCLEIVPRAAIPGLLQDESANPEKNRALHILVCHGGATFEVEIPECSIQGLAACFERYNVVGRLERA